jgi:hypothetical protein
MLKAYYYAAAFVGLGRSDSSNSPVADLGYVRYAGYTNSTAGVTYYRAIPYAQPPLGQLRWQKPRPIEAHNNFGGALVNATEIGPACYNTVPSWIPGQAQVGSHFLKMIQVN